MSQNRKYKSSGNDKHCGSSLFWHRPDARVALQQSPILQGDMDKLREMSYNDKRKVKPLRPFTQLLEHTLDMRQMKLDMRRMKLHIRQMKLDMRRFIFLYGTESLKKGVFVLKMGFGHKEAQKESGAKGVFTKSNTGIGIKLEYQVRAGNA